MWIIMTTSMYVDLGCHSTKATDLRQPLALPARFQTKSNRSLENKKRVPGG